MQIDTSVLGTAEQLAALLAKMQLMPATAPAKRKRKFGQVDKIKYLTEAQTEAFFRVIQSPRDKAIFRVIYHRGLRASEVGTLQLTDYNVRDGRITFARKKGSIGGEYHLTKIEVRALNAWIKVRGNEPGPLFPSRNGTAISQQMLDVLMKKYCAQAGIPRELAHTHALKHSCATHLLALGETRESVQDHMGHRSSKSTDCYMKFTSRRDRERRVINWGL